MKYSVFALSSAVLLCAGCASSPGGSSSSTSSAASSESAMQASSPMASLTITLHKSSSTDAQATVHSTVNLQLSGVVSKTIDLGDILGDVQYVNPNAYAYYDAQDRQAVAVLTSWWAGVGDEYIITKFLSPSRLQVDHWAGDEQGTCAKPETIASIPVPSDLKVSLQNFGEMVDQSSIQFCHTK